MHVDCPDLHCICSSPLLVCSSSIGVSGDRTIFVLPFFLSKSVHVFVVFLEKFWGHCKFCVVGYVIRCWLNCLRDSIILYGALTHL